MEEELTPLTQAGIPGCGVEISILFVGRPNSVETYFSLSVWIPEWVNNSAQNFKVNVSWINSQF
jgi:hypothetical protein